MKKGWLLRETFKWAKRCIRLAERHAT